VAVKLFSANSCSRRPTAVLGGGAERRRSVLGDGASAVGR